jgi:hypothetical protein
MKKKQNLEVVDASVCHYITPFIIACVFGFVGGFCRATGFKHGIYMGQITTEPTEIYHLGLIFYLVAIFFDLIALKAFLIDVHVRALEVFYGKKRTATDSLDNNQTSDKKNNEYEYWE